MNPFIRINSGLNLVLFLSFFFLIFFFFFFNSLHVVVVRVQRFYLIKFHVYGIIEKFLNFEILS